MLRGPQMPAAVLTLPPGAEPVPATPFIKWAGGKTSLLPELLKHVPGHLRRYHEPFVGGGALFFAVAPRRAALSDANGELIHCWRQVRDDVHGVLDALSVHVYERSRFEAVRALDPARLPPAVRAARFIYLNKTCFNGLWRVNRAGRFNVPFGRYRNPTSTIRAFSCGPARRCGACRSSARRSRSRWSAPSRAISSTWTRPTIPCRRPRASPATPATPSPGKTRSG